ncbi:hypothetical protein [Novosphingobium sp. CCH12-A3]|uniref:hypothetical protein n=1 Tax=Novosphingobium sp. CCH12-A3 TaxID=1768752 RepID=UPI000780D186|nr:hypothetical protein [Novosphingobium sp. CCH12-A3]
MGRGLNRIVLGALSAGAAVAGSSCGWAQESTAAASTTVAVSAVDQAKSIPPLTTVEIVLDVALGSKISKTGETFPFHLAKPIILEGVEVVPAGTPGEGEVIHAKKGGGGGAPGELILAAKYLQLGARRLRLRSLKLDSLGNDKMGTVTGVSAAAAATVPAAALLGLFITGGEKTLPMGIILPAKTAEAFAIEPPGSPTGAAQLEKTTGDGAGAQGRGNR